MVTDPTFENEDELEDAYASLSIKVDKATLKLFIKFAKAGKLERALDLTQRLHLEQSFDIAVKVADEYNQHKLSDRILNIKDDRFLCNSPTDEDNYSDDDGEEDASFTSVNSAPRQVHDIN